MDGLMRICGSELLRRMYSRRQRAFDSGPSDYIMSQLLSISIFLLHMLTMRFHLHLQGQNILKRIWTSKMSKNNSPTVPNGPSKYLQHSDRSLILLLKSRLSEPSATFPSPLYSFYWFCCHRNHRPPCFSPVEFIFIFLACGD